MSNEHYSHNPMIHRDRILKGHGSAWVRQFSCEHLRPLIICRGPIRKEAMDVFDEMGIHGYGILLSEKDSIVYRNALAPELRQLTDPSRVHRVPDYSGADKEERDQRIEQIISIAKDNGYNSIFAGYGFMAEDEAMVAALEAAGLNFIGPCSRTVHDAGLKDEAKRTALRVGVSVTPGEDNATALTLLKKYPDVDALKKLAQDRDLSVDDGYLDNTDIALTHKADHVLAASYEKGIDLYTVEELCETLTELVVGMFGRYPENRIRLKAISGGGGKGQRILNAPSSYTGEDPVAEAASKAPELVREILNEVKTTGIGDNKNVLVELNIETTRHQEIQVVGNGDWAISMGGRDCSLQMHEQKLLEVSITCESLQRAIEVAEQGGDAEEIRVLRQDLKTLTSMEEQAADFGSAVGLDSVSTFECIVDRDQHFFMEMNTRIQVEHRVTELCYSLKFTNPEDDSEYFIVESLVETMVLLAAHGAKLPKPERVERYRDSVEARLNATNDALQPHAGGLVEHWSDAIAGEIRDDQGISLHNPDTEVFMKYNLAGAYDSNIALLLTVGNTRLETYRRMAEVLRCATITGRDVATNLEFHYGLVNWFIGRGINARPTTGFIVPYLTAVGELREAGSKVDLVAAYTAIENAAQSAGPEQQADLTRVLAHKYALFRRPLEALLDNAHCLSGWLSLYSADCLLEDGKLAWQRNPLQLLADTYHFLNMDYTPGRPAAEMIWDHDWQILKTGLDFYAALEDRLGIHDWRALEQAIEGGDLDSLGEDLAAEVTRAHEGHQAGLDILAIPIWLAAETDFDSLRVNPDLSIHIPERLLDSAHQATMAKQLAPPATSSADEILAASGGMFYSRETPESEPFVSRGHKFKKGDPLYIVEVMKMFNKVLAPFSGTIDEVLVESDGLIISKGQPLFKITPDEVVGDISSEQITATRHEYTRKFILASGYGAE